MKPKIHPPLIERITAEEKNKKDPLKAAKTRLHQIFGAYSQVNSLKKANALLEKNMYTDILNLHASTKERLPYVKNFYEFVAQHTGAINSVLDLGCGFNPFCIPLMPEEFAMGIKTYHAYDIDIRTRELLNKFFELQGLPPEAKCADLVTQIPQETVDLALMLKLIPVLEAQRAGRGFELANNLNACFLVISYPLKSLCGREKGMKKNYSASFENAESSGLLSNFTRIASERIGNELVHVLRHSQFPKNIQAVVR